MLGVMRLTFDEDEESMSGEEDFFSVARTIPLVARNIHQFPLAINVDTNIPFIPREVTPWLTAFKAYSKVLLVAVVV